MTDIVLLEPDLDRVCRLLLASERSLALVNRRALAATLANVPPAPGQVLPPAPPFAEAVAIAREDGQLVERTRLFLATHPRAIEELTPELVRTLVQIFDPTGRTARLIRGRSPYWMFAAAGISLVGAITLLVATTVLVEHMVSDSHKLHILALHGGNSDHRTTASTHPSAHIPTDVVAAAAAHLHERFHQVNSAPKPSTIAHAPKAVPPAKPVEAPSVAAVPPKLAETTVVPAVVAKQAEPTSAPIRATHISRHISDAIVAAAPVAVSQTHIAALHPHTATESIPTQSVAPLTELPRVPMTVPADVAKQIPNESGAHHALPALKHIDIQAATTLPAPPTIAPGTSASPGTSHNSTEQVATIPTVKTPATHSTGATPSASTRDDEASRFVFSSITAENPNAHINWVHTSRISPELVTVRASIRNGDTTPALVNYTLRDNGSNFTVLNAQR